MKHSILKHFWLFPVVVLGLFFNLWHIDFGLPHTFPADEPEISEVAIFHTFELKNVIRNNDVYKLVPVSYVYGTFPAYLFTFFDIVYVQITQLINYTFDKTDLFIFMRSVNAVISLILVAASYFLSYLVFKRRKISLIAALLTALNWKIIVHSHYLNVDLILSILLLLSLLSSYFYFKRSRDTFFTIITGILFGLATGTKVTAAIVLPAFIYLYLSKRDVIGFFGFLFTSFLAFMITNPFSIIFIQDFAFRVYSMATREAGLVFDSVDYSFTKYLSGLSFMLTPLVFISGIWGIISSYKNSDRTFKTFLNFLLFHLVIYFVFYTVQSRRVDRWLLPVLPILLIFASVGIDKIVIHLSTLKKPLLNTALYLGIVAAASLYFYHPAVLLKQFQKQTPKSEAYIWSQQNIPEIPLKFVLTEEGHDPFGKLPNSHVHVFNVYESKSAQLSFPPKLDMYEYIVISSRPAGYFKKKEVKEKYPYYYESWDNFLNEVRTGGNFDQINSFKTTNPNLIPVSEVEIYKKI